MYERAVSIYEDSYGVQHAKVSEVLNNMAKLYYEKVSIYHHRNGFQYRAGAVRAQFAHGLLIKT